MNEVSCWGCISEPTPNKRSKFSTSPRGGIRPLSLNPAWTGQDTESVTGPEEQEREKKWLFDSGPTFCHT